MRNIDGKDRYFLQSLSKGLALLSVMAKEGRPMALSEISNALSINKTTVTRLSHTLEKLGYVHRDKNKHFCLSPKVLTLGYGVVSGLDWLEVARYYLKKLFEEVNECVNLSVLDGGEILYLVRIRREGYLPFDIRVGTKLPVHCTAMGKIFMAMGQKEVVQPVLDKLVLAPVSEFTITDKGKFMLCLEDVLRKGYAVNVQELAISNIAIAAPVLDRRGNANIAINIAVPMKRYHTEEDVVSKFLKPLLHCADQISQALNKMETPFTHYGNGY